MKTPLLHHQRRHNPQASARQSEARDMRLGQNVSSYQYLRGISPESSNEFSNPEHSSKETSKCQEFRISPKSSFPPHRYYSRACRRQKGSTSHLGITSGVCGNTDLAKNCPNGVQIGRESMIFTPNLILPHPAPTQPSGQRPPERSQRHETWSKR